MTSYGYKLMSEEHGPADLVRNACRAEEAGFEFVAISDHFHPWVSGQAHSPAAWTVLGAVAARTQRIGGRFTLGVGAGENLNEHVVGGGWPPPRERQDMLFEAIEVISELWRGEEVSHDGPYFDVDRAKLWDVPEAPPRIAVAAGGPRAARLAGERGLGLFRSGLRPHRAARRGP